MCIRDSLGYGVVPDTQALDENEALRIGLEHLVIAVGPGNTEGFILVEGLRIGDYTVSEVRDSSSDGYLLPADKTASVFEGAVTEVEMHNEKKPALEVPQTGDNSHMALWLGLLGISGIGAAAILLMRKRKK